MAGLGLNHRAQFSNDDDARYESDWRKLNEHRKPQQTTNEAEEIAGLQLSALHKLFPRRKAELNHAREAIFAA